jgi:3-hydroxyisobutyrate dehydrogenase
MRVGIAGLGRMGRAMAARLGSAATPIPVWNRTPGRGCDLPGTRELPGPEELGAACDIMLTSLTDDAAVRSVYDRLLAGPVGGKLFIETSTIRPDTIRPIAAQAAALGALLVDAPLAGGPAALRAGEAIAFLGGTDAGVERARPVLARFCRRIEHLGPSGAGTAMKLVANLPIGVYFQALAEALALGRRQGLALDTMLAILVETPGALPLLPRKLDVLRGAAGAAHFDIAGVRKDLLAMTAAAQLAGVPTPAASAALGAYAAASAAGWGSRDFAEIARFWTEAMADQDREPRLQP